MENNAINKEELESFEKKSKTLIDTISTEITSVRDSAVNEADALKAQTQDELDELFEKFQKEAEEVVAKTEAERERYIANALAERKAILKNYDLNAEYRFNRDNNVISSGLNNLQRELNNVSSMFQSTLNQTGSKIVELEKKIETVYLNRAFSDLKQIYDAVYQLYCYAEGKINSGNFTEETEAARNNYEAILDVISEALLNYGITVICPAPGEAVDTVLHEVENSGSKLFTSRKTVKQCICCGYLNKKAKVVIQKAIVRV